jgi:hypothetical protein
MALEHRVLQLEKRLAPARWVYTTTHFEGCEAEEAAIDRIRARWPIGERDVICILTSEAMGRCPLAGQPHSHAGAEVQRMPYG